MPSPKLSEIQTWLQWAVLHPDGVSSALEQNDPREPSPRCIEFIESTDQFSKTERLQIYSNAYILRLREVLAKDFPITARFIGNTHFPLIVEQYLNAYPPADFNIGEVARHWPKFLGVSGLSKSLPYISAVASIEWEIGTTYYSSCLPPIDPESLKKIPQDSWDRAKFILDPTIRFLETDWSVDRVWTHSLANGLSSVSELLEKRFTLIVIHRTEETGVQVKEVNRAQFEILKQMHAGQSLGSAIDAVNFDSSENLSDFMIWFRDWVEAGIIRKVSLKE